LLKIGLTGGIASGKTTVGEMFVSLGAHLIQADQIAHDVMNPGEAVYEAIVCHFGREILNPDKTINRARLAEAAFETNQQGESRIQELNRIVHPEVLRRQEAWMENVTRKNPSAVAIVEAALILEAGAAKQFDKIIVVICQPEQRVERWARRMNVDQETARREVNRRMAAQFPDDKKMKSADYVIDNSGSIEETRKQVEKIYAGLRQRW